MQQKAKVRLGAHFGQTALQAKSGKKHDSFSHHWEKHLRQEKKKRNEKGEEMTMNTQEVRKMIEVEILWQVENVVSCSKSFR